MRGKSQFLDKIISERGVVKSTFQKLLKAMENVHSFVTIPSGRPPLHFNSVTPRIATSVPFHSNQQISAKKSNWNLTWKEFVETIPNENRSNFFNYSFYRKEYRLFLSINAQKEMATGTNTNTKVWISHPSVRDMIFRIPSPSKLGISVTTEW